MFDAEQFLDQSTDQSNDTVLIPVPVGEYTAVIEKVTARQWVAKDDPTKTGVTLDITWEIDSPEVRELLGREKVTVRQGIMLDLTETGNLDMGKGRNVGLGRLREAVDLNIPGQPFSFNQLPGRVARVSTGQRADKNDPTVLYSEVKSVAKLS